jgi:hypothetical protein
MICVNQWEKAEYPRSSQFGHIGGPWRAKELLWHVISHEIVSQKVLVLGFCHHSPNEVYDPNDFAWFRKIQIIIAKSLSELSWPSVDHNHGYGKSLLFNGKTRQEIRYSFASIFLISFNVILFLLTPRLPGVPVVDECGQGAEEAGPEV